jgi:UrcA family protein
MKRILWGIAIGVAASMSMGTIAVAEEVQEVVVTAKGVVAQKPAGKTATGIPLVDVALSYGVSYAGLDLASAAGAAELEKRVNDAAKEVCKEISSQRPLANFTTSDAECTKAAADKAMVTVHALIAAAGKKPAK